MKKMDLKKIQQEIEDFLKKRKWLNFSPSDVFVHLEEELGEIGKHILFCTGYKTEDLGHKKPSSDQLSREFAQAFSLFIQLCIIMKINLEEAWIKEFEIMKERFPITDN